MMVIMVHGSLHGNISTNNVIAGEQSLELDIIRQDQVSVVMHLLILN